MAAPLSTLRLDIHLGYAILLPAGAAGGDGASWWLLLAPLFMSLRWVGHNFAMMTQVRRGVAVGGGMLALGALLMSASGTLTQALSGLRGGGGFAYALAPVAFILTYFGYLAPASLLPGAIARAWRGEGFNKPRKKGSSWLATRLGTLGVGGKEGVARVGSGKGGALTAEEALEAAAEEAAEKKQKRIWTVIGTAAMMVSIATGSDVPIFACFFAQLFKADPSKLLQVMIDKGDPARAEMDQKMADKAGSFFKMSRKPKVAGTSGDGDVKGDGEKEGGDQKQVKGGNATASSEGDGGRGNEGRGAAGAGAAPA